MKYLTFFISLSFVGMAVFGFAGMASDPAGGHPNCLAVMIKGGNCPELNPFAFSVFHIEALKTFSVAVLAAMALFFAVGLFNLFFVIPILPGQPNNPLSFIFEKDYVGRDKWLMRWLSLHENSPSLI